MNVLVHSKTLKVTEAMREFAWRQAEKMKKFSQPITELRVFVEGVRNWQGLNRESWVKVKVGLPGRSVLVSARANNVYAAIARAMEDAGQAVRKRKELRLSKKRIDHRLKLALK